MSAKSQHHICLNKAFQSMMRGSRSGFSEVQVFTDASDMLRSLVGQKLAAAQVGSRDDVWITTDHSRGGITCLYSLEVVLVSE